MQEGRGVAKAVTKRVEETMNFHAHDASISAAVAGSVFAAAGLTAPALHAVTGTDTALVEQR